MKLIEDYNLAVNAIYDHVGCDWDTSMYELIDMTNEFFILHDDCVYFSDVKQDLLDDNGEYCVNDIPPANGQQTVFVGKEITMIFLEDSMNNDSFLGLFDNTKQVFEDGR